ncbi:MAG TPA: hypothetical protein VGK29_28255 [Paludibaculum sp.]
MKRNFAHLVLSLALCLPALANLLPPDVAGKEAPAKKKKPAKPAPYVPPITGSASDSKVSIEATAYLDHGEMTKILGHDPGQGFLIVQVKFKPAAGETIRVDLDDFLLRSDRSGEISRPLEAAQIAGTSVMVISSQGGSQGTPTTEQRRIPIGVPGGIPGGRNPDGSPQGMPLPNQSPNVGSATADTSDAVASIEERGKKNTPLLTALKEKILPTGETDKEVSGLLYFQIEGRQRPKDIELVYRKSPPRVSVRFVDPNKKK